MNPAKAREQIGKLTINGESIFKNEAFSKQYTNSWSFIFLKTINSQLSKIPAGTDLNKDNPALEELFLPLLRNDAGWNVPGESANPILRRMQGGTLGSRKNTQ